MGEKFHQPRFRQGQISRIYTELQNVRTKEIKWATELKRKFLEQGKRNYGQADRQMVNNHF